MTSALSPYFLLLVPTHQTQTVVARLHALVTVIGGEEWHHVILLPFSSQLLDIRTT